MAQTRVERVINGTKFIGWKDEETGITTWMSEGALEFQNSFFGIGKEKPKMTEKNTFLDMSKDGKG